MEIVKASGARTKEDFMPRRNNVTVITKGGDAVSMSQEEITREAKNRYSDLAAKLSQGVNIHICPSGIEENPPSQ